MFSLGMRLKTLREERRITQAQLAKELGVKNQSVVAYWETDRNKPSIDRIVQLCDYFNVTSDFLLGRRERSISLSDEETNLIDVYRRLDSRGQKTVYNLAQSEHDELKNSPVSPEYHGIQRDAATIERLRIEDTTDFSVTINRTHPAFAEMTEKARELRKLQKETGAGMEGITRFLWMLGHGSKVRMIDIVAIMRGLQTPHPIIYDHIRAYLTKDFTVTVHVDTRIPLEF